MTLDGRQRLRRLVDEYVGRVVGNGSLRHAPQESRRNILAFVQSQDDVGNAAFADNARNGIGRTQVVAQQFLQTGIRRRRRLDGQLQQPFRALRRCAVGTLVIDDGERMQSVLGALRLERQPQVDQLLDVGLVADRNEYLHLVPVGFLDVRRLLHSDIVRPLLR